MNKRISQANVYVKNEMYEALLKLLEEKSFSAISVSDITTEANVSRMSFYRNYNSIEDILIEHLDAVVEQYKIEDIDERIKETIALVGLDPEDKKTVKKLLKNNLVDFLGSDCHKPNQIYLLVPEAIKKIKKLIGDSKFEKISTLNPQKILKNEEWEYEEKN